jgi:outer membrane protein
LEVFKVQRIKYFSIFLILFFVQVFFFGDTAQGQNKGRVIPLNEFIAAYINNSYDLKASYEKLREAKANKLAAESSDDITLSATLGYANTNNLATEAGKGSLNQFSADATLSKNFAMTGTTVQIEEGFGLGKFLGSNGSGNTIGINVIQPVLKNFFGYLTRNKIKQTALALKAAEIDYEEALEVNIVNAVNLYLDWVKYHQEQIILKEIIANNEIVFNQTRAQLLAGIAEVSDLEISRASVIDYQQRLLTNRSNTIVTLSYLNNYLPVSNQDKPDVSVVTKALDLPNISTNPNYIRSIRSLNYLLESVQLALNAARNQYLPTLDVVLKAQFNSGKSQYIATSSNGASGTSSFFAGVQFAMPLFFMQERANEMLAVSQYENILLQRDQAVRDILNNANNFKEEFNIIRESLNQQSTLTQALQRQVISETAQYRRGSLPLENLVTGRNSLSNSRLQENNVRIQSYQIYNQYLALIDKLSAEYKDAIPEELRLKDAELDS